jgi:hypothetical protein
MTGARAGPRCARVRAFAGCVLRKPLVSRIALEGLIIERTVAAAARALSSRAEGVHRRGARAALCNQLLKLLTPARGGARNAALAQARRSVNNPPL